MSELQNPETNHADEALLLAGYLKPKDLAKALDCSPSAQVGQFRAIEQGRWDYQGFFGPIRDRLHLVENQQKRLIRGRIKHFLGSRMRIPRAVQFPPRHIEQHRSIRASAWIAR
jgi:hypothetical protein